MRIIESLPYEWIIGLRYTRARRRMARNSFISFIALICVSGIALGVAALIVVLSVMNGFEKKVTERMLSVLAHVEVFDVRGSMPGWRHAAQEALRNPQVRAAAPFAETQGMLLRDDVMKPAVIRGVLPDEEIQVSGVANQVRQGSFAALQPGSSNIMLGSELARALGVQVGDRLMLLQAGADMAASSARTSVPPRARAVKVAAIFEAGHYQFDSTLAYVHLADIAQAPAQAVPAGLRLRLANMHAAPRVAGELKRSMSGELVIRDWSRVNVQWFAAVQSQKRMMFVILAMIIAVATFNLVSTLVMTVKDKQADIAILRTLGASPRSVMKIFMVQGTLVGVLGTGLGIALGVALALNVDVLVPAIERAFSMHFLSKDVYLISEIPSELRRTDVFQIGSVAVLLSFLATIYPSWSASRLNPAAALRHE
jgi:lipoprotein-releasing system permease protein